MRVLVRKLIYLTLSQTSRIGFSIERHSSVVGSAHGALQIRSNSIPTRTEFLLATLPDSSLQGTSVDLQSDLPLLLSRINNMESSIVNVNKTNNLLHERATPQD